MPLFQRQSPRPFLHRNPRRHLHRCRPLNRRQFRHLFPRQSQHRHLFRRRAHTPLLSAGMLTRTLPLPGITSLLERSPGSPAVRLMPVTVPALSFRICYQARHTTSRSLPTAQRAQKASRRLR
jgi:hypothetical protein